MSKNSNEGSFGKRRSIFALSALKLSSDASDDGAGDTKSSSKALRKKSRYSRMPNVITDVEHTEIPVEDNIKSAPPLSNPPKFYDRRPSLTTNTTPKRPSPLAFESLKNSVRINTDEMNWDLSVEPLSATSSNAPSLSLDSGSEGTSTQHTVLIHGDVQTSANMFRKKKEYLVLTDVNIIRYKSQSRAAEMFRSVPPPTGRSPSVKHTTMPSVGSYSDNQSLSDSSGDKYGRVPIKQVVAVHKVEDGKPYFALEFYFLEEDSGQASSMTLQFGTPDERDDWLALIRKVVNETRIRKPNYISPFNLENAARIVERDNDYDPENCTFFKVVQRQPSSRLGNRSTSDELTKVASVVCFLAIGVHKVHLIPLVKPGARTASPVVGPNHSQASHGIMTLSAIKVNNYDDTFELTFRQPLQKPKLLLLASSASYEIAARLHYAENFLRPESRHQLFRFNAPRAVENLLAPPVSSNLEEYCCLVRTLTAYCVSYGVNPANIRYTVNPDCEDGPRFELLAPSDSRRQYYNPLELLAIMRALRYNESFGTISFANISLDGLNGLNDSHGTELVCTRTKRGTPIKLTIEELGRSCLLVQEVRALAATSKKLRRMDFTSCVTNMMIQDSTDDESTTMRDIGCGVVEALVPLCKHQTTNLDWICLNGIKLSDTDMDYLVGAAVEKSCHFRAIELNRCGLSDRSMGLILDALRAQENTLESLQISGNNARLNPAAFDNQLGIFGFIHKLNLSNVSITSGAGPLLQAETLLLWRLQELRLSGTALNAASVDAVATYLAHPQSDTLHELYLDNSRLTGNDIALLLHSMIRADGASRNVHLDISSNPITRGLEKITDAISKGFTPSHLTVRGIEYREEYMFRKIISAITANTRIQYLDMSQTALPGDAGDDTCRALGKLLAENSTIIELDLSGDESRLATSKFGPGINDALLGLRKNTSIRVFRIEKQKLGIQGASTLAEVLRENNTLSEVYCENNEIPLHGLTDLVNSLIENTTLIYLPAMSDGRAAAFKAVESTMKVMSDPDLSNSLTSSKTYMQGASAVRRGFASVRKTAQRSASVYTPSFPALPSYRRTSFSPDSGNSSPPAPILSHPRVRQNSQSAVAVAPSSSFTVQDIQMTHRLLAEQWDRQCYRLGQYLERNWCLLNGIPCNMEVEDEKFERPESVGSIGKMLEQVKIDRTPRAEKKGYFNSPPTVQEPPADPSFALQTTTPWDDEKHWLSVSQSALGGSTDDRTSDSETSSLESGTQQLRIETKLDRFEGPRTPTQKAFSAV